MKVEEYISRSELQESHYQLEKIKLPVIDSSLYTTLGKRLFDLYKKYEITQEDQRDLEMMNHLLVTFVLSRSVTKKSWLRRKLENLGLSCQ